jgi:hypothetical protein
VSEVETIGAVIIRAVRFGSELVISRRGKMFSGTLALLVFIQREDSYESRIRKIAGSNMGSESSEQVLALLGELSVLKELNQKYEASPSATEEEAYRQRQQRHEEITQEIKALAERKKHPESAGISDAAPENT